MSLKIYATLVLTTFFWGGTFIAGRVLAGSVPPAAAAFYRYVLATVTLGCLVYLIDGRLQRPAKAVFVPLLFLGLTGVFGYNVCFFTGLHYVGAGRASLIIALNPLAITVGAALFLQERLSLRQLSGIAVSLAGALIVIGNGDLQHLEGGFGWGEAAILGCVVCWAAYSIVGRGVLRTLSPLAAVFYSSLIGTCLLFPAALLEGSLAGATAYHLEDWLSLSFLGVCGTAIGFSLYYQAIRTIGATRSAVFINLVPLFAVLLGWLVLDETIKLSVLSAGLLVLAGVSLTNRVPGRAARAPREVVEREGVDA